MARGITSFGGFWRDNRRMLHIYGCAFCPWQIGHPKSGNALAQPDGGIGQGPRGEGPRSSSGGKVIEFLKWGGSP
jgi:hypothetical protein